MALARQDLCCNSKVEGRGCANFDCCKKPDTALGASAALRRIGTNISPALGYFDTPALNLATATPLAGAPPTPIPAGTYDAGIVYKPSSANTQCLNGSSTEVAAFLIQVRASST